MTHPQQHARMAAAGQHLPGHSAWERAVVPAAAIVMAAHGLVHLIGMILLWKLGQPGQLRYADAFPAPGTGPGYLAGALWLAAAVLFVLAAALLMTGRGGWRLPALAGVIISAPVIGLTPDESATGLAVDAVVLAVLVAGWLRTRAAAR
jgi:hypothetical protein